MIDPPGDHPLPHPELHSQEPLVFTLSEGEVLYRHHQSIAKVPQPSVATSMS
jgi:hypothetical protein